ncbi:uncharacterized protein PHACADRAFT_266448, partial [Phanerochaete carnosa HHB-10118-sp]
MRPESLWSSGEATGQGEDERATRDSTAIISRENLQLDIHEEQEPNVAFPKYDRREPECLLSWHHSGMYLTRESPETKSSYAIPSTLPPDTTAVRLPGMQSRFLVKHVSLVVEVPAYIDDDHSPLIDAGGVNAQFTGAAIGDAWAGYDDDRHHLSQALRLEPHSSSRHIVPHRELIPRAQEFSMSSPVLGSYVMPGVSSERTTLSQPNFQHLPNINTSVLRRSPIPAFAPSRSQSFTVYL